MSAATQVILNTHLVPVAAFQQNRDLDLGGDAALGVLARTTGYAGDGFDATARAEAEFGNAILANMMMLGVAWQKGLVPLPHAAIERAITLNGVSVKSNLAAFAAGRRSVAYPDPVRPAAAVVRLPETLDEIVEVQAHRLRAYQNAAYADVYRAFVADVATREAAALPGSAALAIAVARNLGKLMAFKDEYEVARLHRDPALAAAISEQFEGDVRLLFNLAPPLFARRDPYTGHLRKREFGAWMLAAFGVLAPMKRLRGTALDPFGYSAERRQERALIGEYRATIENLLPRVHATTLPAIVAIAALPDRIRGFGHVKEAAIKAYASERARALQALYTAAPPTTTRQMETSE
jgi:indolepyruvate ferredoxin oxidoreductase